MILKVRSVDLSLKVFLRKRNDRTVSSGKVGITNQTCFHQRTFQSFYSKNALCESSEFVMFKD